MTDIFKLMGGNLPLDSRELVKHDLGDKLDHILLYPFSDSHVGSPGVDYERLEIWRDNIKKRDNAYFICIGDLINNAIKSSVSNTYKETMTPEDQIYWMADFIEPIKDKCLGIVPGNHEARSTKTDGKDPMKAMARFLGLQDIYSSNAMHLYVSFGRYQWKKSRRASGKNRGINYLIYVKHGAGGGRKKGGKVNRLDEMKETCVADVYIQGHTHNQLFTDSVVWLPDNNRTKYVEHRALHVNSNAWIKNGGYGESYGFAPVNRNWPCIALCGKYKRAIGIVG